MSLSIKLPSFDLTGNTSGFYPYTGYNTRGVVNEGYFRSLRDGEEYRRGQEVLYTKMCKFTNTFFTVIVEDVEVSYYFNDRPIYRVWPKHGDMGILMPLIHSSIYDSIIGEVTNLSDADRKWLEDWNKARS